jgi:hypothetical protein
MVRHRGADRRLSGLGGVPSAFHASHMTVSEKFLECIGEAESR